MKEVLQLQPELEDWSANRNFELVLVTADSKPEIDSFLKSTPLQAHILLDPTGEVFQKYNIQAIPTDILVYENGSIVRSFIGWSDDELIKLKTWIGA